MGSGVSVPEQATTIEPLANPKNALEAALFTPAGAQCAWQDANEYAFRIQQLDIINHAILVLASILSPEVTKDVNLLNFKDMQGKAMAYANAYNENDDIHPWTNIANDPMFLDAGERTNIFQQFSDYFTENAGTSSDIQLKDFQKFVTRFIRIRDKIISVLGENCIKQV
jgi:hypothetical protein